MIVRAAEAKTVGWVYNRRFLDHDPGASHVERPERLEVIVRSLQQAGLLDQMDALPFSAATAEQLTLVHDPAYVDLLRMMCDDGFTFVGSSDTGINAHSYEVAALAAGGVLAACDAVMAGRVRRAFCAVRPPGHHAETDQALGFCLFNHVAIAAEHLVRHHQLSRVAIVDFDVHHGNGTQHIFESRRDVFYISLHECPGSLEFPGTGAADEIGSGDGQGYTLNVPLDRGSGEAEYRAALEREGAAGAGCLRPAVHPAQCRLRRADVGSRRASQLGALLLPLDYGRDRPACGPAFRRPLGQRPGRRIRLGQPGPSGRRARARVDRESRSLQLHDNLSDAQVVEHASRPFVLPSIAFLLYLATWNMPPLQLRNEFRRLPPSSWRRSRSGINFI